MNSLGDSGDGMWTDQSQIPSGYLVENGRLKISTIPDSVVYDLESGGLSNWEEPLDMQVVSDVVYNGTYSAYVNQRPGDRVGAAYPYEEEKLPSKIELFCRGESHTGGGIRVYDASGNVIFGFALSSPEWIIDDGNGLNEVFAGDGEGRWIQVIFDTIDWGQGTFDVYIEDLQSGSSFTDSGRPLKSTNGVAEFEIHNFANLTTGWTNGYDTRIQMWFDDIGFYL